MPKLIERILELISSQSAGSPTDTQVKWTHLKPAQISKLYEKKYGEKISNGVIKRILKVNHYRKRKPSKVLPTGISAHKNEQFEILTYLVGIITNVSMKHNPLLSIDTKKKEILGGKMGRNEGIYGFEAKKVYDHDYPHLADGKAIPHGIYDVKQNKGYITLGNSHETADFIVDNLRSWWLEYGSKDYPNANYLTILCDAGGSNGHRHHRFKQKLQQLSKELGLRIIVCHYPPYCSKYNPIERQLFAPLQRTISGQLLVSLEQLKALFSQATTQPKNKEPLKVLVRINTQKYETGLPSSRKLIDPKRILYHPEMPNFNYTILP
jgi:hypothetical protein